MGREARRPGLESREVLILPTFTPENAAALSGGPLHVEPAEGDNLLFVYSADGLTPNVALSYFPSYFFDRTS